MMLNTPSPMCKRLKILALLFAYLLPALPAQAAEGVLTSYFPVLSFGAGDNAVPQLLPILSNAMLSGDHAGIKRAVVVIHDGSRDAAGVLAPLVALAGSDAASTIIVAPHFLLDTDIAKMAGSQSEQRIFARWPLDGWIAGGDSIAITPQKGTSSFTVLDMLLLYLGERKFFPDIQDITVAGNGAGGDFVQRYAAAGRAPDILAKDHIPTRFIVANPSSYLYFTGARLSVDAKTGRGSFGTPAAAQCPAYNNYPYGLDNLNNYARRAGASEMRLHFSGRSVIYLLGGQADRNQAAPGTWLDESCAALLEGPDRMSRAANYSTYMGIVFGDEAKTQKFTMVPEAGYNAAEIFASRCGTSALFGDGTCEINWPDREIRK